MTTTGALLYYAENNTVNNNELSDSENGIFASHSTNNHLTRNCIFNNSIGTTLMFDAYNNTIIHNNFIDNNQSLRIRDTTNIFDNGIEGNYWSDYSGEDINSGPYQNETGSDGIGDTPYVIDGENQDDYPMMHPYGFFPWDVTGDGYVGIDDIVGVAQQFGESSSSPEWNSKYDITGDSYVGIDDIVAVAEHFGAQNMSLLSVYTSSTF